MKKNKKAWAQYLLAGMLTFFGGKAKADSTSHSAPATPSSITATSTQTNLPAKPNFACEIYSYAINPEVARAQGRLLFDRTKHLLKLNEDLKLQCYRDNVDKATLGLGCNIQDFSQILKDLNIPLIWRDDAKHSHACLGAERDDICARLAKMSKAELARISILPQHVEPLARETYAYFYERVSNIFAQPDIQWVSKNGKTTATTNILTGIDFASTPYYLQAAVMDTFYQLGETKFTKQYHLLNTAIREGKYAEAFAQLAVNRTDKTTQKYKDEGSARRAFRKDVLGWAHTIAKDHPKYTANDFVTKLASDIDIKVSPKKYNGVINQIEKNAAFRCTIPFIVDQFYSDLSPKQQAQKKVDLMAKWNAAQKNLREVKAKQAVALAAQKKKAATASK